MSAPVPPQSSKHRVEFTENAAPKKRRKPLPLPQWIVGWFGGLLLFVVGAGLGGFVVVELIWMQFAITDDIGSFFGALFVLLLGAVVGAGAGSLVGLFVWGRLRARARESQELDG